MANQGNGFKEDETGQSDIGHPMKRAGRRDFLGGPRSGRGGRQAAAGATGFSRTSALAQQADNDVAILEFALNLEYLRGRVLSPRRRGPWASSNQSKWVRSQSGHGKNS